MMGKKLVSARISSAVADLDFTKKKAAADDKTETEKLKKAHDLKKNALKDQTDALNDKMSSLETNDALKAIGQAVRIKAKSEAAKKLLKAADAEESKELKIKLQQLAQQEEDIIKSYSAKHVAKKEEPKKPEPKKEEPKKPEPKNEEPKKPEPKKEEPKNSEPKKDEPVRTEDTKEESEATLKQINDTIANKHANIKQYEVQYNAGDRTIKKKYGDLIDKAKEQLQELKGDKERELEKLKKLGGDTSKSESVEEIHVENNIHEDVYTKLSQSILSIKNQLETNADYNRTNEAKMEVERKIKQWESALAQMNELNASSIESAINIGMAQLDKDIFALNSKRPEQQSEQVRLAMQEAAALGGAQKDPQQAADENVAKLDKTRALMKAAGLI